MTLPKMVNGWIRTRDQFPPMDPENRKCSKSVLMARYAQASRKLLMFVGRAHIVFDSDPHWVEEGYYDNRYPKVYEYETYWFDNMPPDEIVST